MTRSVKMSNHLYRALSFVIPFGIFLLCFALHGFDPFGSLSPLIGDAGIQYYPFLALVRRALHEGEGLLYTWRSGLGGSFLPVIAYFCVNFFNLIALFLPQTLLASFLSLSICVRMGLAGLFFSVLVQTIRPKLDITAPVFAVIFALNSWIFSNYWQTVWLDCVALTPLVAAGLIRMVRDKDFRLYPLALGLSLMFNFYLSFITCCMSGLIFIGLLICYRRKGKALLLEIRNFLGFSVLAAMLAAVLLIPTAIALGSVGNVYGQSFHGWKETLSTIPQLLGQLVSFADPIINKEPANLGSSMLVVLLLFGYLTQSRIPLRERLYTGFVVVFLFLSCWWGPLNFAWHGFHYPHVTVERFGYLMPFVLAFAGWRFTASLPTEREPKPAEKLPFWRRVWVRQGLSLLLMLGFSALTMVCAVREHATDVILVCALFTVFYCALYLVRIRFPKMTFLFSTFLVLLVCGEITWNTYLSIIPTRLPGKSFLQPDAQITEAIGAAQADADANGETAYRLALSNAVLENSNAELLYDIPAGSSAFHSMIPDELKVFCGEMGMDSYTGGYYYRYKTLLPFASMLLNMRYVISSEKISFSEALSDSEVTAWRTLYPGAMGYCTDRAVTMEEVKGEDALDTQNTAFAAMTGLREELFTPLEMESIDTKDMTAKEDEPFMLSYEAEETPTEVYEAIIDDEKYDPESVKKPEFTVRFRAPESGSFCIESQFEGAVKSVSVLLDGKEIEHKQLAAYDLTYILMPRWSFTAEGVKAGQEIAVQYRFLEGEEGQLRLKVASFDEETFQKGYERLMESPFEAETMRGGNLRGTVNAREDSTLYLSVPYDEGWSAYVDGEKVPVKRFMDAMSCVDITAGEHTVSLKFRPRGLILGAALSLSGLCLYIAAIAFSVRKKRRGTPEKEDHADT